MVNRLSVRRASVWRAPHAPARLLSLCLLVTILPHTRALFGGHQLEVRYGDIAADGNLMRKNETDQTPTLFYGGAQAGEQYTIIMVDPDHPDPAAPTCKWYVCLFTSA